MIKKVLITSVLCAQALAFSTTNLQYLYGNFQGPTFLDTQANGKHTITGEHYRTFEYGDVFAFFDYVYTDDGLQFTGKKNDLYGEISPRLSLSKLSGNSMGIGIIKDTYLSFQYNRGDEYHAWLYGAGMDLDIPFFSVFGVNVYRKIQNFGDDTYQLSLNYLMPLGNKWHFEGFTDWTSRDIISQNQLLFNLSPTLGISSGTLEIGTEWHYYHENVFHTDNDVFQAMIKYSW